MLPLNEHFGYGLIETGQVLTIPLPDIKARCNSLMRFRLALSAHAAYHRKKFATKTIGDYLQVRRIS